jgi:hypothetical protein
MTSPTTPELSIRIIPGHKNPNKHSALPWRWTLLGIHDEVVAESPEYPSLFECTVYAKTFIFNMNNPILIKNLDPKLEKRYGSPMNRVDDYFNHLYDEVVRERGVPTVRPKLGVVRNED